MDQRRGGNAGRMAPPPSRLEHRNPAGRRGDRGAGGGGLRGDCAGPSYSRLAGSHLTGRDRKSTPLNSSHLGISYAVFCLKKNIQHGPDTSLYLTFIIALITFH